MTFDLGTAVSADAQAFGSPGQRTFQLRIIGEAARSASLWIEKEQLQALGMAFSQMLAQTGQEERAPHEIVDFPNVADRDLRVGRMEMGYNATDETVVLNFFEQGNEDEKKGADVRVRLSQEQCAALNVRVREIIAAGRPACPLCGAAVDPSGHVCIRANGHTAQPIPERQPPEEEER